MMNELTIRQRDLPAMPMEEVKQYVDIIGDAIDALKAKRNAAGHLNADKAVIDEMDGQIREYSAMKLKAEIELGKKTAEIPKAKNQSATPEAGTAKKQTLDKMGISHQRASDYERLARHEDIVQDYISDQLERGETPTKSGAFKRIAQEMPKPKELKQMAEDKLKHLEGKEVITLEEVQEIKEYRGIVDEQTRHKVWNDLRNAAGTLTYYRTAARQEMEDCIQTASNEEIRNLLEMLDRVLVMADSIVESIRKRTEAEINNRNGVKQ